MSSLSRFQLGFLERAKNMTFVYPHPHKESLGNIQTPPYVARFLYQTLKHLKPKTVLDPSCGIGNLLQPWFGVKGVTCMGIEKDEILLNQSLWPIGSQRIHSMFEHVTSDMLLAPPDLIMSNPPWVRHWNKGKSYPEVFLRRIVDLFGPQIPLVFLCPMGTRLNQRGKSERWKWIRDTLNITSIISCPLDMYPKTEFHSEILLFNIKRVKPHYWMCERPEE